MASPSFVFLHKTAVILKEVPLYSLAGDNAASSRPGRARWNAPDIDTMTQRAGLCYAIFVNSGQRRRFLLDPKDHVSFSRESLTSCEMILCAILFSEVHVGLAMRKDGSGKSCVYGVDCQNGFIFPHVKWWMLFSRGPRAQRPQNDYPSSAASGKRWIPSVMEIILNVISSELVSHKILSLFTLPLGCFDPNIRIITQSCQESKTLFACVISHETLEVRNSMKMPTLPWQKNSFLLW